MGRGVVIPRAVRRSTTGVLTPSSRKEGMGVLRSSRKGQLGQELERAMLTKCQRPGHVSSSSPVLGAPTCPSSHASNTIGTLWTNPQSVGTMRMWDWFVARTTLSGVSRFGSEWIWGMPSGVVGRLVARYDRTRPASSDRWPPSSSFSHACETASSASATSASKSRPDRPSALIGTGTRLGFLALEAQAKESSEPRSDLNVPALGRSILPP